MLRNYDNIIHLGDGKFAYTQNGSYIKTAQDLCERILSRWSPPKTYFHLRKGGHVAALKKHSNSDFFTHLDIDRFFGRITKNKIVRALKSCGFNHVDAMQEAGHSIIKQEGRTFLPYGFTQSPLLASLCLDRSKAGLALRKISPKVVLSVYVDDVILSCDTDYKSILEDTSDSIIKAFDEAGFPISSKKKSVCQHKITSFNVKLGKNSLSITNKRMDEFRNKLESCSREVDVVNGILNYVRTVNPNQAVELDNFVKSL